MYTLSLPILHCLLSLFAAGHRGVLNIVLVLLEAGARCDEKNAVGATPLHKAANNGHVRTHARCSVVLPSTAFVVTHPLTLVVCF